MPIHISNKKVNDIHVGTKKVLTTWIGTDRVYLASTLSMLIKGYTEKSGDSLLNANTPLKFTGENLLSSELELGGLSKTNGNTTSQTDRIRTKDFVSAEPNNTYTIYKDNITAYVSVIFYNINKQFISYNNDANPFTTPADCYFIKFMNYQNTDVFSTIMLVKGSTAPTTFEPYHETFYNPTEGFSLNKVLSEEETFETITGILTKKTDVRVNDRITGWTYNLEDANTVQIVSNDIPNYKGTTAGTANLISNKLTNIVGNYNVDNLWVYGSRRVISIAKSHLVGYSDDLSREEKAQLVADYYNSLNVSFVYLLNTPQTYQKKHKVLPQWVKHVFDSSGRELEATITQ